MKAKDLIQKLKTVPPEAEVIIFNSSYEWYGAEELNSDAVSVINNEVVIFFGNHEMSEIYDLPEYYTQRRKEETIK